MDSIGSAGHEGQNVGRKFSGFAEKPEDESHHADVQSGEDVLS